MSTDMRRRFGPLAGLALAIALAGCQPAPDAADDPVGGLDFSPCALDGGAGQATVDAQCATLEVPEDHDRPDGRRITLKIARLPASGSAGATDDPVFFFAGGPGQAATDLAWHLDQALGEVRRQRDIVLVDQRGTGGSNPLTCLDRDGDELPLDPDTLQSPADLLPYVRRCLASLEGRADPRLYTTGQAIADFEAVRQALGAERINLVGASYGTRAAQQYAAAYPAHVRTMVIDGVAPNDLVIGGEFDRSFEQALELQAAQCAQDAACGARFGTDVRTRLRQVMDTLQAAPVEVEYMDPRSGERLRDTLTADTVTGLVFLFSYAPHTVSLLPLLLEEAAEGRYASLMSLYNLINQQVSGSMNRGMQWSVICAEDAPRHAPAGGGPERILGPEVADMFFGACQAWPAGTPRAGHTQPLQSDLPVLLLSGELDPVTPPEYAERVLPGLANGRHLVLRGQSHGTLAAGCMPKLVAQFIESADADGIDADCLADAPVTPAFVNFNGWGP